MLGSGELVVNGLKGTATIALPADLAAGTHQLTAVYAGSADVTGSQTQRSYRVTPATTQGGAHGGLVDRRQGREGQGHRRDHRRAGAPVPTGSVTFTVGLQRVATVPLADGTATVTLPAAQRSSVVVAYYTGNGGYLPTVAAHTLTVTSAEPPAPVTWAASTSGSARPSSLPSGSVARGDQSADRATRQISGSSAGPSASIGEAWDCSDAQRGRPTGSEVPHPHTPADESRTVQVEPLNAAEQVWAAQHREIITGLCAGTVDTQTLGDLFDRVQAIWLQSEERDRTDPESLVHAFGVSLGDLVAQRVPGLVWGSARGDGAPELVLTHPEIDLVVFPVAAVAESWGRPPSAGWRSTSRRRRAARSRSSPWRTSRTDRLTTGAGS